MTDRAQLLAAKLRALVSGRIDDPEPAVLPGGAALTGGDVGWVLLDGRPLTALGPALVWAERRALTELNLIVDAEAGVIARRAALFTRPPAVWEVMGTALRRAYPAPSAPQPAAPAAPALEQLLVDAGVEVVVEDGIMRGEVLGLEVARVVHGTTTAGTPIDEPVLEVGVGHADREMTAMVHGTLTAKEQLARVVQIVRAQRQPGALRHPLNQLAPERWLRIRLVADPARIGLSSLEAAPPAVPRPNLRDPAVAMAVGRDGHDHPVVVACAVGIHLDLVPAAADARDAIAPGAHLLLVVPERDAHPVTQALAVRLVEPAELVPLAGDWRR